MSKLYAFILSGFLCVSLIACGGGGGGGNDDNGIIDDDGDDSLPLQATFSSIQINIFSPRCAVSSCHGGLNPQEGLSLVAGNSFAELVNIPSSQNPSVFRVNPGFPDNSYLIQKLEGTAATGERMPRDSTPLSTDQIAIIRQWIQNGALDN